TSTDTRGITSLWTPRPSSQLKPRTPQPNSPSGSKRSALVLVDPNPGLETARHSPLAPISVKSHWGTKSPFMSSQVRLVELTRLLTGCGPAPPALTPTSEPTACPSTYLLTLTLS